MAKDSPITAALHARLGEAAFNDAWAAGRSLTTEQAASMALALRDEAAASGRG